MITWTRPSGSEITTNEEKASIEYAEANGWKRKVAKEAKPVKAVKQAPKKVVNKEAE